MGPCAAGTAYIPGLADFVPMVKGRGSMALAGPHLVRAAVGEDVTQEELGGSRVHCRKSGVGDLEVESDEECIAARSRSTCRSSPRTARRRRRGARSPTRSTAPTRSCSTCCPESNRKPYDMYDVIRRIVDDGEWFDLKRAVGEDDHHLPRAHRRAAGRASSPTSRASSAASSTTTRPTRPRASSTSATRSGSRSCSCRTCRASWSAPRSRRRGSSATARRCSTRSPTRPSRRSPS